MGKLVILLVFIGIGIIRTLADNAAKRRQREQIEKMANMQKDQRAKVQSEIEAFLQGVTGGPAQPPAEQAPPKKRPRRQPRAQQRRQKPPRRAQRASDEGSRSAPAGLPPQEAHLEDRHLQSSVQQHVKDYMGKHGGPDSSDAVPAEVVDTESAKSALRRAPEEQVIAPHAMLALLRTPEGVRQAIIAHEILKRPRTLRR